MSDEGQLHAMTLGMERRHRKASGQEEKRGQTSELGATSSLKTSHVGLSLSYVWEDGNLKFIYSLTSGWIHSFTLQASA